VKEKPILFSAPMIKAILEDRKTQTRRIVKHPEYFGCFTGDCPHEYQKQCDESILFVPDCPYGTPGDRLWVRETFCVGYPTGEPHHWSAIKPTSELHQAERRAFYRADGEDPKDGPQRHWTPSIHMPRWASRITLEVTGVRVERLQTITEADARAEGVERTDELTGTADDILSLRHAYSLLWEQINGAGSWESNPFVWCISFSVVKS
jgi:hypothetical protein